MVNKSMPRGIRNGNPGNIRWTARTAKDPWIGLDTPAYDTDPIKDAMGNVVGRKPAFCRFKAPVYGIRALARTLITYQERRLAEDGSAIDTVQEIITRWAPAGDNNDPVGYAEAVRRQCKIDKGAHVDLQDFDTLKGIVKAIIQHENGQQPYNDAQITKGLVLVGVEPEKGRKSRTMRGAYLAGGATALGTIGQEAAQLVDQFSPVMRFIQPLIANAPWILGVLALVGLGVIVWARMDDRNKGLR